MVCGCVFGPFGGERKSSGSVQALRSTKMPLLNENSATISIGRSTHRIDVIVLMPPTDSSDNIRFG